MRFADQGKAAGKSNLRKLLAAVKVRPPVWAVMGSGDDNLLTQLHDRIRWQPSITGAIIPDTVRSVRSLPILLRGGGGRGTGEAARALRDLYPLSVHLSRCAQFLATGPVEGCLKLCWSRMSVVTGSRRLDASALPKNCKVFAWHLAEIIHRFQDPAML